MRCEPELTARRIGFLPSFAAFTSFRRRQYLRFLVAKNRRLATEKPDIQMGLTPLMTVLPNNVLHCGGTVFRRRSEATKATS